MKAVVPAWTRLTRTSVTALREPLAQTVKLVRVFELLFKHPTTVIALDHSHTIYCLVGFFLQMSMTAQGIRAGTVVFAMTCSADILATVLLDLVENSAKQVAIFLVAFCVEL